MASTASRFGKWFLVILALYILAIILSSITGSNKSEKLWGFILYPIVYLPFYLVSLLPAFLLAYNSERHSKIIYLIIILICLPGMAIPILNIMSEVPGFNLSALLPFFLIFIRTIYKWSLGY